jgi:hypothetical protein
MKHVFIFLKNGIVKNLAKTRFTHKRSGYRGRSSPYYRGQLSPMTLCNLLTELLFITNITRFDPVIF